MSADFRFDTVELIEDDVRAVAYGIRALDRHRVVGRYAAVDPFCGGTPW
jgi:hypothetical protein